MHPRAPEAEASTPDTLNHLLAEAGITKDSIIRVTGPSGLSALLWFCRHGYQQVGYVRPGRSPGEDGDLVFAPHRCELADLARLLEQGAHVRAGGLLIVQTPQPRDGDADPARNLLAQAGFRVERRLRGHHRQVHVARRVGVVEVREAA